MFDACKRDTTWFSAAISNDVNSLKSQLLKNKGSREFRATQIEIGIIKGFTALHYACFNGCTEAVKVLLDAEIGILTQKEAIVKTPGLSNFAKYKIPSGSSCLSIALLRGKGEIVNYIVNWLETNVERRGELIGKLDDDGMCTYLMGCLCTFPEALQFLQNKLFVDGELFIVKNGDMTAIMTAAYFGRPQLAQILYQFSLNPAYQQEIYKMALQRDMSDCTCIDLAKMKVDYDKCGCTLQDREQCANTLRKLCREAYSFAVQQNWRSEVQFFLHGQTLEQIFDEPLSVQNQNTQPIKAQNIQIVPTIQNNVNMQKIPIQQQQIQPIEIKQVVKNKRDLDEDSESSSSSSSSSSTSSSDDVNKQKK